MTTIPPGPIPPVTPKRVTFPGPVWMVVVAVLSLVLFAVIVTLRTPGLSAKPGAASPVSEPISQAQIDRAQPHTIITYETSKGGSTIKHGKAEPSSFDASGDGVDVSAMHLDHTLIDFDGLSIMGGGVAASFKVSGKTLAILKWLCVLLAIPCIISGTIKWVAKDFIHAIGQGLCALGLLLAAMDTDLLAWFGLGAVACLLVSHWFPAASAKVAADAQAALADVVKRGRDLGSEIADKIESDKHGVTIAAAVQKSA